MKGLAHPETATGIVQRALTDEWQKQAAIALRSGFVSPTFAPTLTAILERLVRDGRAETIWIPNPLYMSGGYREFRRPQKDTALGEGGPTAGENLPGRSDNPQGTVLGDGPPSSPSIGFGEGGLA